MTPTTLAGPGRSAAFLRSALRVDGWSTGIFGGVLLAGAGSLRGPLGLPIGWSIPFGVVMLGGALALLSIARRPVIRARHARAVVAVNALSAVGMIGLAGSGVLALTGLGVVFLLIGAATVATFAGLECAGLRELGERR
ncbi:hypothetical protein IU486_09560 [Streptomyces gardneri]|uniref:hypothetical protein n=1 Tax=Nocardia TaxID=1817 RepID=UPI00135C6950|nr:MULTISPECIES: hypothetical protein [Nocardia]MBF6165018.1 hypothetical protein [Streptomyces gardneri]MBF6206547.1 hypothetical protein [Streptomyces gardneri]